MTFTNAVKHTLTLLLNPIEFESSGDMIFSGHTRFIVAGWCAMSSLITPANLAITVPIYIVLLVLGIMGIYFFIVCRLHFSVDILLAVFITSTIWYLINTFGEIALSSIPIQHQTVLMRVAISFFKWFNN